MRAWTPNDKIEHRRSRRPWPRAAVLALLLVAGHGRAAPAQTIEAPRTAAVGAGGVEGAAPGAAPFFIPDVSRLVPRADNPESLSSSLQILVVLTILTIAPGILLMTTCFVRILVVLALLRQAIGTQSLPPSQVIVGLALFLTFLVMAPTWESMRGDALDPYLRGELGQLDALERAGSHLRGFMFDQIEAAGNEQDVYMLYEYALRKDVPETQTLTRAQVPLSALVPAFVLSELKAAFVIGFRIYLPFLVIDMVVATVLVAMGMMMLPPVLISLPFKLLLFVVADGWHLVVGSLMASVV